MPDVVIGIPTKRAARVVVREPISGGRYHTIHGRKAWRGVTSALWTVPSTGPGPVAVSPSHPSEEIRTMALTRRRFLHLIAGATSGFVAIPLVGHWQPAAALGVKRPTERVLRLGHVMPAAAGKDSPGALGVQLGLEEAQHAGRLFGVTVELSTDADAERLVRQCRPHVVIGGSTEEDCVRLSDLAITEGLLFFNVGCASDVLRGAACRRNTFHITAAERMRRDALAQAKVSSGDAEVLLWHESLERYGAGQLNPRFRDRFGVAMNSDAWAGWIAVKIAAETCFRGTTCSAEELLAALERPTARFDGHKGRPLSFRATDHQLRQPMYVLQRSDPSREIIEVPGRAAGMTASEQLDQLGAPAAQGACTWDK